jgi:hypothetical protein
MSGDTFIRRLVNLAALFRAQPEQRGVYVLNVMHDPGCPAISSQDGLACTCIELHTELRLVKRGAQ